MIRPALLILCALATSAIGSAHAHSVWIEPSDGQVVIRFAEPGDEFETSPGHLDSLSAPVAFKVETNTPVAVKVSKGSDRFVLAGVSTGSAAGAETTFTIRGGRKPLFYARWQPEAAGPAKPLLTLDLVPTGKAGEVRVYFRGKPLGGIKATLRTPDEKEQELTADADGFLRFTTTRPGLHLLTMAHYREDLAGFYGGIPYEQTSHNSSLTWRQP